MKPFDLEAAKRGEPVQTRDGRPARIICFDRVSSDGRYPLVVAFFGCKPTHEDVSLYTPEGRYSEGCTREHPLDLVMAPVEREGWVNIYGNKYVGAFVGQVIYDSEDEARKRRHTNNEHAATVKITWEE